MAWWHQHVQVSCVSDWALLHQRADCSNPVTLHTLVLIINCCTNRSSGSNVCCTTPRKLTAHKQPAWPVHSVHIGLHSRQTVNRRCSVHTGHHSGRAVDTRCSVQTCPHSGRAVNRRCSVHNCHQNGRTVTDENAHHLQRRFQVVIAQTNALQRARWRLQ